MKDIDKKRIMIGRDYRFFVMVDSVSSLGNDWNRTDVLDSQPGDSTRNSIP